MNLQKYIDLRITLDGKTCRSAFWIMTLLYVVMTLAFFIIIGQVFGDEDGAGAASFYTINAFFILVPIVYTTMMVRRMHDIGKTAILPMCWLVPYLFVAICNVMAGPNWAEDASSQEADAMSFCILFALLAAGICFIISMIFAMFRSKETGNA